MPQRRVGVAGDGLAPALTVRPRRSPARTGRRRSRILRARRGGRCLRNVLLALLLLLLLGGCRMVGGPPGNLPFAKGKEVAAIRGCFAELGAGEDATRPPVLSAWLWPDAARDPSITSVCFEPRAEGGLVVEARAGRSVVRTRTIETLPQRPGRIRLPGGTWFSPFFNQGDEPPPIVGPYAERSELGLDTAGDLKLRRKGWAAGLAFLVVPIFVTSDEHFRFARLTGPGDDSSGASAKPRPLGGLVNEAGAASPLTSAAASGTRPAAGGSPPRAPRGSRRASRPADACARRRACSGSRPDRAHRSGASSAAG